MQLINEKMLKDDGCDSPHGQIENVWLRVDSFLEAIYNRPIKTQGPLTTHKTEQLAEM